MKYTVVPLILYQPFVSTRDKSGALSHYLQKYINQYGNISTNIWGNYSESGKISPLGVTMAASSRV